MKKQSYIKGALIISIGGLISKLLGALYRIPLATYLGGEGMGIYQLVYPLYCILLTVSASGIPTGMARLVSCGSSGGEKRAFFVYGTIGLVGALIMFFLAQPLAVVQGELGVAQCCRLLAPSVFFVSVISVTRGYFQGKANMYPTALTEVMEQAVKVIIGVLLVMRYSGNPNKGAAAAVFAVTISECVTFIFAAGLYFVERDKVKPLFKISQPSIKTLVKFTLPLTISAIALPVSQLFESIVAVNVLRKASLNATSLYGIYSGCAVTLVNLPVSLTYGLAAASVPQISPLVAKGDFIGAIKRVKKSIAYTAIISIPFAVGLYFFSPLAVRLIFSSLNGQDRQLLIKLVKILSVNAITASLVQTTSTCVTSLGKPMWGAINQWSCSVLRVVLSYVFTAYTSLSIIGVALSANVCYFVAVILNLCYITVVNKSNGGNKNVNHANRFGHANGRFNRFGKVRTRQGR